MYVCVVEIHSASHERSVDANYGLLTQIMDVKPFVPITDYIPHELHQEKLHYLCQK
jgi:hypothetical protein